jgi:hypothetical protein
MLRRAGLFVLLLSVFWHYAAMAGGGSVLGLGEESGHAVLHWQEQAHHHDDHGGHDGDFHVDDSSDSLTHLHLDGALTGTALPVDGVPAVPRLATVAPADRAMPELPTPPPTGLRRPPRHLA